MDSRIARRFLQTHPRESARVLERLNVKDVASFFGDVDVEYGVRVLSAFLPADAARVVAEMPAEVAGEILSALGPQPASAVLRLLDKDTRERCVERLRPEARSAAKKMLRFPPSSAGAMMEPRVVSFRESRTVGEALDEIRANPRDVRFDIYVVDDDNVLRGVVSLRDLMTEPYESRLGSIMRTPVERLPARAGVHAIVSHPAFRRLPRLPVVDERDRLVGVFLYETLQTLAAAGTESREEASPLGLAMALSELFWIGASGLVRGLETK
jgi:magnesium transporter